MLNVPVDCLGTYILILSTMFDPTYWILQTVAMLVTCLLLPKLTVDGPIPALLTVVALSFINAHLWSSALFLQIPDSFTNKALLLVLTNGVLFWVIVKLLPGISIEGVWPAVAAPVIFSIFSLLIDRYKDQIDWAALWQSLAHYFEIVREYFSEVRKENSWLIPPTNPVA